MATADEEEAFDNAAAAGGGDSLSDASAPVDPGEGNHKTPTFGVRSTKSSSDSEGLDQSNSSSVDNSITKYDYCELEDDVYSLVALYGTTSRCSLFALFVFALQILIVSLNVSDLFQDRDPGNPLNLPIDVSTPVAVAQAIALVLACYSQDDMRTSLSMIAVGYDPEIRDKFKSATRARFIFSNILRFVEGFAATFVIFLLTMQADSVIEIFINFAATEYISCIDNIAFELAMEGYLGANVKRDTLAAKDVRLPVSRPHLTWIPRAMLYCTSALVLVGWVLTLLAQRSGVFLSATSCSSIEVFFGEEIFILPPGSQASLKGSYREQRQKELQRFDPQSPPPVMYSFFSGHYEPVESDLGGIWGGEKGLKRVGGRPIYKQGGLDDDSSGTFYYCTEIGAWVFTIPALGSALPERGVDECGYGGWLMRSPPTDTYLLENVDTSGWLIWTGEKLVTAENLRSECMECSTDTDCNYIRGKCNNKKCDCVDGWAGHHCHFETPFCPRVNYMYLCTNPRSYFDDGPYDILVDGSQDPINIQGRPVYFGRYQNQSVVFFYGGSRWFVSAWDLEVDAAVFDVGFHAYWDAVLDPTEALLVSDPTEKYTPEGIGVTWNRPTVSHSSKGSADLMTYFRVTNAVVLCDQYCNPKEDPCGYYGTCNDDNVCECNSFAGGPFCEFEPGPSEYMGTVWDELQQAINDPDIHPDDYFADMPFYHAFWARQVAEIKAGNDTTGPSN